MKRAAAVRPDATLLEAGARGLLLGALLSLVASGCGGAGAPEPAGEGAEVRAVGAENGLAPAPGVALVATHCTPCHSARLISQNRGDAADWRETIRWMQQTQGLWELAPEEETAILGYLSTQYPRQAAYSRRAPLPPSLLPPPRPTVPANSGGEP